jgi:uncharacterized protein YrrD
VSDSFHHARGRKVVSRSSAHELGTVSHLLVTVDCRQVTAVIVGRGKKALLVDWSQVSGFGADAVMVTDESSLRAPGNDREQAAADGKLEMIGTRALTESGNELGTIDDIVFDPTNGAVTSLNVADRLIPADSVVGSGSYAVVVAASQDPL